MKKFAIVFLFGSMSMIAGGGDVQKEEKDQQQQQSPAQQSELPSWQKDADDLFFELTGYRWHELAQSSGAPDQSANTQTPTDSARRRTPLLSCLVPVSAASLVLNRSEDEQVQQQQQLQIQAAVDPNTLDISKLSPEQKLVVFATYDAIVKAEKNK